MARSIFRAHRLLVGIYHCAQSDFLQPNVLESALKILVALLRLGLILYCLHFRLYFRIQLVYLSQVTRFVTRVTADRV
jgi:hypothetical protein